MASLRSEVDRMEQAVVDKDFGSFLQGDLNFHVKMAEATGNPLIIMIINRVVTLMRAQQEYHVYLEPSGGRKSQQHHQLIMAALEKRDPELSHQRMKDHICQVRIDVNEGDNT
jgi:GntR family transcriptional repressor for pyruvate dehydrogenase complex